MFEVVVRDGSISSRALLQRPGAQHLQPSKNRPVVHTPPSKVRMARCMLPKDLQAHLTDPRRTGARHDPEIPAGKAAGGIIELPMVEEIEKLRPELYSDVFPNACGLMDSHIRVDCS